MLLPLQFYMGDTLAVAMFGFQPAKLEVGSQVPIITQTVTQTVTSTPAVVNSISYVQTGVVLNVTPRVKSRSWPFERTPTT